MVPQRLHDLDLARRATQGDPEAWQYIWDTFRPKILRLMTKMVGPQDAEDCTQDAFLLVHRKLHLFKGNSQLGTWLFKLSVNVALMSLRRRRYTTISLDTCDTADDLAGFDIPITDVQLDQTELRVTLEKAIAELPDAPRTHFLLHALEGFQHKEIAKLGGFKVNASKKSVSSARESLKRQLRPSK
jgi:RNA polymerase sigma-70 factor (ECF subfamily)